MTGCVEDTDDPMEEDIPKILSSEISDVFPFFVNMLDIKSFMKLAMTSKSMYNRCMEDKRIRIKIEEKKLFAENNKGKAEFSFISSIVKEEHVEKYVAKLSILNCNLTIDEVAMYSEDDTELQDNFILEVQNYLEFIGVKSIDSFSIQEESASWERIILILKNYRCQHVEITSVFVPDEVLLSLLEMNLKSFSYIGSFDAPLLAEADIHVQKIDFTELIDCNREIFLSILSKVQEGPLSRLMFNHRQFNIDQFETLDYYHDQPLPNDRPLVFRKTNNLEPFIEFFFLHWNGGVTKCSLFTYEAVITKCDPIDLPISLKKKEDVHEALSQRRLVDCSWNHFQSFFEENFNILDSAEDLPLPEERPLFFKEKNSYLILNLDNSLEKISWIADEPLHFKTFDLKNNWPSECGNPALARFIFQSKLESIPSSFNFTYLNTLNVDRFFEKYKKLPFDYHGPLPEDRPLLFEIPSDKLRWNQDGAFAVLNADGSVVMCDWLSKSDDTVSLEIHSCSNLCTPSISISTEILQKILMRMSPVKNITYRIDLELFRSGFSMMKTVPFDECDPLPEERPLVLIKTKTDINGEVEEEDRLLVHKYSQITKCEWKNGLASFSKADPWEFPLALKMAFVTESNETYGTPLSMTPEQLVEMFEEDTLLPFDHEGPLPEERPLGFKRAFEYVFLMGDGKIRHFGLNNGDVFHDFFPSSWSLPSALITTYRLREILLQLPFGQDLPLRLSLETFRSAFEGLTTISHDYAGPLPDERPLVVEKSEKFGQLIERRWFLFDDQVKECEWMNNGVWILSNAKRRDFPRPLMKLFINDVLEDICEGLFNLEVDYIPDCLEGLTSLPFDYWGPLPEARPLVFLKPDEEEDVRFVLLRDDSVAKCEFWENGGSYIDKCPPGEMPSILMTAEHIEEILIEDEPIERPFTHRLDLETFLAGFSCFKTLPFDFSGPLPEDRPLVFKKNEETSVAQRWCLQNDFMMKCEWKDGYASFSTADPREFPLVVTTTLVKEYLQGKWEKKKAKFFLDYSTFLSCFKDCAEFTVVPFDFSGQLPKERPLVFKRIIVEHSCLYPVKDCGCSHLVHSLWRLYDMDSVSFCSWSENKIIFSDSTIPDGLPPALKTKDHLKNILLEKNWRNCWYGVEWHGSLNNFVACFMDFTCLPFNHDGPLPEDRPLVFESGSEDRTIFWFLLDDDMVIECSYHKHASLCPTSRIGLPHSLEVYLSF